MCTNISNSSCTVVCWLIYAALLNGSHFDMAIVDMAHRRACARVRMGLENEYETCARALRALGGRNLGSEMRI